MTNLPPGLFCWGWGDIQSHLMDCQMPSCAQEPFLLRGTIRHTILPLLLSMKASAFHLLLQTRLSELCYVTIPPVPWSGYVEVYTTRLYMLAEWMNKWTGSFALSPSIRLYHLVEEVWCAKMMRKSSWGGRTGHSLRVPVQRINWELWQCIQHFSVLVYPSVRWAKTVLSS